MDAYYIFVKNLLLRGHLTADEYNEHIVSGVEQGWLKDITPRTYVLDVSARQVVGAYVQFPDDSVFLIEIFDKSDREKHIFDYDSRITSGKPFFFN